MAPNPLQEVVQSICLRGRPGVLIEKGRTGLDWGLEVPVRGNERTWLANMVKLDPQATASFALAPEAVAPVAVDFLDDRNFSDTVLRHNVIWFINLRWVIVGILAVLCGLTVFSVPEHLGLQLTPGWIGSLGAALALVNIGYWLHYRRLPQEPHAAIKVNLWVQIVVDLISVTVVVHFAGSTCSYAPFLYAIHIILACVFFPTVSSLVTVALSSSLYAGCVLAEWQGWLAPKCMYINMDDTTIGGGVVALQVASAIILWVSIWLIAARLSRILRLREHALLQTQRALSETYRVGQEHMRHTTHQMKAPLDAIRSNISLLRQGFAGEITPAAEALLDKIDGRAEALAAAISAILDLASLKAGQQVVTKVGTVDLKDLLEQCLEAVEATARARRIQLNAELQSMPFRGNPSALRMLFDNLLTNAVNYSHDGGRVEVRMAPPEIQVVDHGIGIPADKLDRIFEEFYRTPEAKQHNHRSSGVGMAIVRHAAALHGIQIKIRSKVNRGTTVTLVIPEPAASPDLRD